MRRRWLSAAGLALVAGLAGVACGSAAAPPAAAAVTYPSPTAAGEPATPASPATPAPPDAKAWVVVDADTGAVVASSNDHALMRPASIIKVLTALMAVSDLPPGASVPVGLDAAGTEAAKIDMKAGQVWSLDDTLHSLLIVSANDAAVALADRVGGTEEGFAADMASAVSQIGITDRPELEDPAGLDDSFSYDGGDFISAWDMAVIARDAMSVPAIRSIVSLPIYRFTGPDGVGHVLHNHNKLLSWDPTVVGIKPGWTVAAGETFITEAVRNGRSMIVVEMGASPANMYAGAEFLLGQGFSTPVSSESGLDHLPPIRVPDLHAAPLAVVHRSAVPVTATVGKARGHLSGGTLAVLLAVGLGLYAVLRRRTDRRRVWHAATRHPASRYVEAEPTPWPRSDSRP
ncbi:MAG TPA: serine hydrolase, partial [Acidimicrobiales bacterium]|nr:serine hydrolase [Acidimicrobiales bacterium]